MKSKFWPRAVSSPAVLRVGWQKPSGNGSEIDAYGVKPPSRLAVNGVLQTKPVGGIPFPLRPLPQVLLKNTP